MPEKANRFMAELDAWVYEVVMKPLYNAWADHSDDDNPDKRRERLDQVEAVIMKQIRERVWQSYKNGQAAGPRPAKAGEQADSGEHKAYRRPFRRGAR